MYFKQCLPNNLQRIGVLLSPNQYERALFKLIITYYFSYESWGDLRYIFICIRFFLIICMSCTSHRSIWIIFAVWLGYDPRTNLVMIEISLSDLSL